MLLSVRANARILFCGWAVLWVLCPTLAPAQPPNSAPAKTKVDFAREVQPIFAKLCFFFHGPDKSEAGLRLNKRESAFRSRCKELIYET